MPLLLCLACAGIAWGGGPQDAPPPAPAVSPMDVATALEKVLGDVIAGAEGSVVAIHRDKDVNARETLAVRGRSRPRPDGFEARQSPTRPEGTAAISFDFGAGVVVGDEGEILTAFHVVRGASRLIVRAAGHQEFDAEVIAADPRSDLAVIAPVAVPGALAERPRLKPIPLGDATGLRKGAFLVVLGNPFNAAMQDGRANASWGILSNVARRATYDPEAWPSRARGNLPLPNYPTLLQLDSKLNLGMSGGAVVNMKGELVGLTTTAASPAGYDAMAGYAFPMDALGRRIVETLRRGREVEYGLLGIRQPPGLNGEPGSNVIDAVAPNSPAALGDLQHGDAILSVNGVPVHDFFSLMVAVGAYPPGEKIRLKILRDGREIERSLVIDKYPVEGEIIATDRPAPWRGLRVDYRSMLMTAPVGINVNAPEVMPQGVAVREIEPGSPAEKAGLRQYQVIREVGDKPVANPAAFEAAVSGLRGPVRLTTDRGPIVVDP